MRTLRIEMTLAAPPELRRSFRQLLEDAERIARSG
jgi:hypothetical protein